MVGATGRRRRQEEEENGGDRERGEEEDARDRLIVDGGLRNCGRVGWLAGGRGRQRTVADGTEGVLWSSLAAGREERGEWRRSSQRKKKRRERGYLRIERGRGLEEEGGGAIAGF